jgi:hypothetical protein
MAGIGDLFLKRKLPVLQRPSSGELIRQSGITLTNWPINLFDTGK